MQQSRAANTSGKVIFLEPVSPEFQMDSAQVGRVSSGAGWRGHRVEIGFVLAVWALALVQVGMVVARGGAWTPDSSLALAFALACPLALRAFRA